MWPLSLVWKKQAPAEAEKKCRVCWGGDEEGEEEQWVAPCRCSRAIAWVHRRCLAWRLKHTPSEEDKRRCAVCKHAYKKRFRLKTLREWFDGCKEDWSYWVCEMMRVFLRLLSGSYTRKWPELVSLCFPHAIGIALGVVQRRLRDYFGYPDEGLLGSLLPYKRLLAVAAYDWYLDAPPPLSDSSSTTT